MRIIGTILAVIVTLAVIIGGRYYWGLLAGRSTRPRDFEDDGPG